MRLLISAVLLLGWATTDMAAAQTAQSVAPATAIQSAPVKIGDVDHVGLAVRDLERTLAFFADTLGFTLLGREPEYPAAFLRNDEVVITLWQVADADNAVAFDRRRNIGLHHLALQVPSFEALDRLHEQLVKADGVRIEFAPELLGNGPAKHMMIYEPGGIRLEFIHRPR